MKNNANAVLAVFALLMVAINIVSAITPFKLSNNGKYYISDNCTYNSRNPTMANVYQSKRARSIAKTILGQTEGIALTFNFI